jgi:hypothetical protein
MRMFYDGFEHGLGIACRAGERAENVGGRRLLF